MSITVMGATGHVGGQVAARLLQEGHQVRALGRSESKLADLARAGAEIRAGDASDATFLRDAFRGSAAVFVMMPGDVRSPDYHADEDARGEATATAVRDSGVRSVVCLSSLGADQASGTGVVVTLHRQEQRLRRIEGLDLLIVRAGWFFENFYGSLGLIKHEGICGEAVVPDLAFPMIASRDIADVVAKALESRDWRGVVVHELLGQRDLSFAEATRIIGTHIGRPDLPYVQFSYDDLTRALVQEGFSESVAAEYAGLSRGINEGRVRSLEGRTPENTTPTRFEDFAKELAEAYRAL